MRKLILIAITFLASVFCVLPFYVPILAASSSQIENVIVNERKVISDLEFQVSMNSVSDDSVISVPQYYTYDRYKYKTVCQPENGNQPDIITCRLYKYDAGTTSASTSQQDYDINASHTDELTLNLIESFGDNVQFSYIVKHIYQIIFTDDNTHSGYIQYSSDATLNLLSDNENVGVNGKKIYFFDKGTFSVYYTEYVTGVSTLNPDANEDITLTSFHEAQEEADFDDIIEALETIDEDVNDIYTYLQKRFDWDIPVESFPFNWGLFYNLGDSYQSIRNYDYWQKYPIFTVPSNTMIVSAQGKQDTYIDVIVGINQNITSSTLNNYFSVNRGTLQFSRHIVQFSPSYRFIHFKILSSEDGIVNLTYIGDSSAKLVGIYLGRSDIHIGLSQDFKDHWFSNISDDQAQEVEDMADDIDDIEDDYHGIEADMISDMDDQLEEIDLQSDPFGNNQASFVSSMSWVVSQFNYFASPNNVMGQLITFVLTIGLALVIIGKLR